MIFTWNDEGEWYVEHSNGRAAVRGVFDTYKELWLYVSDRLPFASIGETGETE